MQQAALEKEKPHLPLYRLREVILKWLELENPEIIDVVMAAYIANQLATDPLWLHVIGPPSHAKTEVLRAFEGHPTTYFLSNLTPATLVSGMPAKKGRPEPSLLPKLDGKVVILKDFTSILSMRAESQQEIIAQLREMYDGQYSKDFGNGKRIDWTGSFGLIGACTPVYDAHYGVIGAMGERFLLYRISGENALATGLRAQQIVGREAVMRDEIRQAVHAFIDQFQDLSGIEIKQEQATNEAIVHLACIVAMGRCPVDRDRLSGEIRYMPAPEGPARLTKQLMQLGAGLALARGTHTLGGEVLKTLQKVGRDLIPAYRLSAIKTLWGDDARQSFGLSSTTKQIADSGGMISKTALRTLEDLMLTGVVSRQRDGDYENAPYRWFITDRAENLIQRGGLLE
ncbi:MAG: hypothetical protein C4519_14850 [Desulfobacteraceae bacterium]|nr:MAG: hypothetical protein C4519_14850 [Desulfobacteraceae bacterium]